MSRKLPKSGPKWMKEGVAMVAADPHSRNRNRFLKDRRANRLDLVGTPHAVKMARKLRARAA